MPSDVAISVRNLTKTYRIFGHPGDRIKQALTFGRRRFHNEFTALNGISFDIRKGETVGIVGRNGSGKSTLLQLICGILKPTSGMVQVNGRISALLELGAGFNPEFTGRENVYFQGALMGLTKDEINHRFEDIIRFAEIGEFIDQPVRTYSSGMFVRLAFSVAISVNPEILVVDEALSVGDMAFQSRCMDKFRELQLNGITIIVVSHSLSIISSLCNSVIQLGKGLLIKHGSPAEVLSCYEEEQVQMDRQMIRERGLGGQGIRITGVQVFDEQLHPRSYFQMHEPLIIQIHLSGRTASKDICIGMEIRSSDGIILWSATSKDLDMQLQYPASNRAAHVQWKLNADMAPGTYVVAIGAGEMVDGIYRRQDRLHHAAEITVQDTVGTHGYLPLKPVIQVVDIAS